MVIFYQLMKGELNMTHSVKTRTVYERSSKTVYFLPIILMFLYITAASSSGDPIAATQNALLFGLVFAILMACMYLPDGLINRPCNFIWKMLTGISFLYLAILIYFSYMDKENVIYTIHTYFDRGLKNYNYQQVSYGADCRIYAKEKQDPFANVRFAFFDLFALAHAAGWFVKTLAVRDPKIIIFESIAFQLVQYSLRDVLNNFKECWWDHVIVDVCGCNLAGILLGFYVIDKFKLERYRWSFRDAPLQTSAWHEFKYFCTHWDLSKLEMKSFKSLKKYLQLSWYCIFFQLNDLTIFFLKFIYQVPPSSYMVLARVIIIGLLCVSASKEFYRYLIRHQNNFKINCFMVHMIVLTEVFIIFKHGTNDFSHASVPVLGYFFLGSLLAFYLVILIKVFISEVINWNKNFTQLMIKSEPYPIKNRNVNQYVKADNCQSHFIKFQKQL